MKVKNITLAIKSDKELFKEVKEVWEKLEKGKKVKKHEGIYFKDLDAMRKILTEERLRILKTVRKKHPSSIYELAKILKRDIKNVSNDVNYLKDMGLIELKQSKEGRIKSTPLVDYEKILLEIPV